MEEFFKNISRKKNMNFHCYYNFLIVEKKKNLYHCYESENSLFDMKIKYYFSIKFILLKIEKLNRLKELWINM